MSDPKSAILVSDFKTFSSITSRVSLFDRSPDSVRRIDHLISPPLRQLKLLPEISKSLDHQNKHSVAVETRHASYFDRLRSDAIT